MVYIATASESLNTFEFPSKKNHAPGAVVGASSSRMAPGKCSAWSWSKSKPPPIPDTAPAAAVAVADGADGDDAGTAASSGPRATIRSRSGLGAPPAVLCAPGCLLAS